MGPKILRIMLGSAMSVLGLFSPKFRWLGHYLWGRGCNLYFPERFINWETIARAVNHQSGDPKNRGVFITEEYTFAPEPHWWSRLFPGKNEMWYVIATTQFTARLDQFGHEYVIEGMDRYWWHLQEGGRWAVFSYPAIFMKFLRLFAPADKKDAWFPLNPNLTGISNQLWADMEAYGAKPFYTILATNKSQAAFESLLVQMSEAPPSEGWATRL